MTAKHREARSAEHDTLLSILDILIRMEAALLGPRDVSEEVAAAYRESVARLKYDQERRLRLDSIDRQFPGARR